MRKIVSVELGSGRGYVHFEVEAPTVDTSSVVVPEEVATSSRQGRDDEYVGYAGQVTEQASQSFAAALEAAQQAAKDVLDGFVVALKPRELELSFGLKISGTLGVVVASTDAEATFNLKAKWVSA